MKLLLVLLFLAVYFGARLLFRVKDVASAAYAAAREAPGAGPLVDVRGAVKRAQQEALSAADYVGELVPGARKAVYEFSLWVQVRMSTAVPGAVQRAELQPPGARAKAGAFLAGALEAFVEHYGLAFTNGADFERFMRLTLGQVGLAYLERAGVEVGMQVLLHEDQVPEELVHACAAGGTSVRMELRGHEPLPFENSLRDAIRLEGSRPVPPGQ